MGPSLRSRTADLPGPAALLGLLKDSGDDRDGGGFLRFDFMSFLKKFSEFYYII
jgi:hypothetical protein